MFEVCVHCVLWTTAQKQIQYLHWVCYVFLLNQYEKEHAFIAVRCLHCQEWIMHRCTVCVYRGTLCLQLCGMKTKDYR